MLKHYDLTRERIRQFTDTLRSLLYPATAPVTLAVHGPTDRIALDEALKSATFNPVSVGTKFGPPWSTHWFRVEIDVPAAWRGKEVHLLWDSVSEGLIYLDGKPVQALTGTDWSGRPLRPDWRLPKNTGKLTVYIEMAVNHLFGFNEMGNITETHFVGLLRQAEIALFDRDAWDLLWDYTVVAEMALELPHDSVRGRQALFAANSAINAIDPGKRSSWAAGSKILKAFLAAHNGEAQHRVSAIGHAHIDTAWLWPLAETRRKVLRTVSTTLRLLEEYPEYKFSFSQAVQHDWVKEMRPDLYVQMKRRVKEGRIVPVGGMWVEPDANLPSGESLIRQLLIGQRWFEREYGIRCKEIWIPDVFGYCAQLPQIAALGGAHRFLTQKLSWNQINKPQHHTFYWEGLDGTRMLTHFPPTDTYNANTTVKEALYHVKNYKDLERSNESYLLFGFGDGGGGPTKEMLERLRRMSDLDGLPKMTIRSSDDFFDRLEADAKDLNTVVGELYFELHRGTYTTQARTKRGMRKSELLLHDVELLAAAAHVLAPKKLRRPYPHQQLEALWRTVLLNQFHDILPGSSINQVYVDAHQQLGDVMQEATALRATTLGHLEAVLDAGDTLPGVLTVNSASVARSDVITLPGSHNATAQTSADGQPLGFVRSDASMRVSVMPVKHFDLPADVGPVSAKATRRGFTLENSLIRATFLKDGALTSLVHKGLGRESIADGARANQFVLHDDNPSNWEAWDVDVFHLEKRVNAAGAHNASVIESGPLRAAIRFEYQLSDKSTLQQTVTLAAGSARLEFHCEADWHESKRFLKVEFPVNVRAQDASYETQFGHLKRPTHFNTSFDVARFEVCAHKWGDLSEAGFGVALLNDCKYGYATHGNVLRLSLLRAPKNPDPQADMGQHVFSYALLPHAGTVTESNVIEEAYAFNLPLLVKSSTAAHSSVVIARVDQRSVVIETVKQADDGKGVIVRLYEAHGGRCRVTLSSDLPFTHAALVNGLEEHQRDLSWGDGAVAFDIAPFQIVSVRLG
jgi:alpha-mannosidase